MSGYTECPQCGGAGEIAFRPTNWGTINAPFDYDTRNCPLCGGTGEVRADVAMDYLEQATS